ncbi:unnamed protein product [Schistosoma rodhaini]|uniref:Uncharacterized protein n=1 Tax=Schistosoma rodhaini TaxID=6188 RepID=A0AA85F9V7_9TREM|nr:unnamed protein product [Schistosoma rodhaini]
MCRFVVCEWLRNLPTPDFANVWSPFFSSPFIHNKQLLEKPATVGYRVNPCIIWPVRIHAMTCHLKRAVQKRSETTTQQSGPFHILANMLFYA